MRKPEINERKNETKRKLNMLDDETNDVSEKVDVDLTTLRLKCEFFEKPNERKNKWNKKVKRRS